MTRVRTAGAWAAAYRIGRFEWRLVRRDRAVWLTIAVLLIASLAAWSTARTWMTDRERLVTTLLHEQERRLDDLQARIDQERRRHVAEGIPLAPVKFGLRHATTIGHYSGQRWVVQPMSPTTPLALGELDLQPLGDMASVDRWQGQSRAQFTSPLWLRFVRFDIFLVVAYLLPLGLMLLCGGIVSAEKEQGTLQLRLTQGGRLSTLSLGRLALRGGLATLLVALVVGGLVWHGGGSIAQLLLWEAGLVSYALFWLSLIAWVDAGGYSVAANLLTGIVLWIVLLFVVPGLVRTVVDAVRPLPSRAAFERAHREAYEATWNNRNEEILNAFYAAHPEIPRDRDERGGLERFAIFQMRALELMRDTLLPLEASLDETARRHRRLIQDARFLSPLLLLHDVATTAAGTDIARVEDFWQQRERFLQQWDDYYVTRIYTREPIDDLTRTPTFEYQEPGLRRRLAALSASLAGLLVPALALVGWSARRYRQYPA